MTSRLLPRVLLVLALAATPVVASTSAHAADDAFQCGEDDVVVVVENGTLGGEDSVRCAPGLEDGASALDALVTAGHSYEETSAASMALLCRIDDRPSPEEESCGESLSGDGYWAFLTAEESGDWGYATTGLRDHEVADGEYVALVYQLLADGEDVEVGVAPDAETRGQAALAPTGDEATEVAGDDSEQTSGSGLPILTVVGALLVVLLLAVGVVVARQRRD